jgi:hypothetical protein
VLYPLSPILSPNGSAPPLRDFPHQLLVAAISLLQLYYVPP